MKISLCDLARASAAAVLIFSFQIATADENTAAGSAELKVAAIFGDNMLLQQNLRVPVWGWSAPGAKVTVKFSGQTRSVHAGRDGKWIVKLGRMNASFAPRTLTIESGETKNFTNILVGEVWLCSGQSNMEKPIGKQRGQKPCLNYEQELATANFPNIRIFKIEPALSATALADLRKNSGWLECSSNSLDGTHFSAAAYFFGREIRTNLNVPVGLIESSWGGTRIEPWTPPIGFEKIPSLAALAHPDIPSAKIPNTTPTVIYNAMIAPIAGFGIRGALWYQGESNCMGNHPDGAIYVDKMEALVGGWRRIWGEGAFPFYYVEIAPFKYYGGRIRRVPSADALQEFWEAQNHAQRMKNTGMAVTTDLVDNLNDIHPRDKQDVGHRLALLARHRAYGEKNVASAGPTFRRMTIAGNKAILRFDNVGGGLASKDGKPLTWFSIAGAG